MNNLHSHPDNKILNIINGLTNLWNNRAKIHEGDPSLDLTFEPDKDDFKEELLPFYQHPVWIAADPALRQQVLSYGWIIYNEKTIQIESKLIAPVCDLIIDGEFPGSEQDEIKHAISQALVDEAFHTLMAVKSINIVYRERGLERIKLPKFELIHCLEEMLLGCHTEFERKLVRLAVACASETLITDYLGSLSKDDQLQPLCYKTVEAHAADEWSHASVFSYTMAEIFAKLSEHNKSLYLATLPKAVKAFGDDELNAWHTILATIQFPHFEVMLADCRERNNNAVEVDTQGIAKLLNSLGIEDTLAA
ncbi:diiron oxygenase [Motilimonas cestriensis]|uniref:Diiron oxygenase n=1 Tax=Motilimonas cestriensis TaxID=2742685 RepID=A0ABS8W7T4_9GAMM|nr:diiron oxygenase [Motilimonas cestriensis]MCE2595057.1 diiron oxygenase [Motilimonas cestriensis]